MQKVLSNHLNSEISVFIAIKCVTKLAYGFLLFGIVYDRYDIEFRF